MKIQKIIGEKGEMPHLCRGGSCPAVILTEEGELFVQGYVPAEVESIHLSGPNGESFVKMPRAAFEKIARQVLTA
jgi:hypothetical protein